MGVLMKLHKKDWKVKPISANAARRLVSDHHYAGSASKVHTVLHGLFRVEDNCCVLPYGCAWWLPPPSPNAAKCVHEDWRGVLMLSRFVLTPDAPKNAASFLLSRSVRLLPDKWHSLVTWADEMQGHTGTMYRASNWVWHGQTNPRVRWFRDGKMCSIRSGNRTLTVQEMMSSGAVKKGMYCKQRYVYYRHDPIAQPVQMELAMLG